MTTLICKQKGPRLWPGLNVLFNSCSYSPIQAPKIQALLSEITFIPTASSFQIPGEKVHIRFNDIP
ncbi:hypothetical protein CQ056_20695 [Peribacillus simplex]|nr:hypothetical protein CQ056_20695 [Peribacillus simplex]